MTRDSVGPPRASLPQFGRGDTTARRAKVPARWRIFSAPSTFLSFGKVLRERLRTVAAPMPAHRRMQSERHLDHAELGGVSRNDDVASKCQLHTTDERCAIHAGDWDRFNRKFSSRIVVRMAFSAEELTVGLNPLGSE